MDTNIVRNGNVLQVNEKLRAQVRRSVEIASQSSLLPKTSQTSIKLSSLILGHCNVELLRK